MSALNIFSFFEYFYNKKHTINEFAVHFESIDQDYQDLTEEHLDEQEISKYRRKFHRYKNKLELEYQIDMQVETQSDRVKNNRPIPTHYIPKDQTGHTDAFLRLCHYQTLNQVFSDQVERDNKNSDYVYTDDRSENFAGTLHLNLLLSAIKNQSFITFSYQSRFVGDVKTHVVRPHFLKEYSGRWYLVGLKEEGDKPFMYGLDRIENPTLLDRSFKRITNLHDRMNFQFVVGVEIPEKQPEEIIIEVPTQIGKYFESLPLHQSQKVFLSKKDTTQFSYYLIPNREFYQKLLMWVEHVNIVRPDTISKEYMSLLKEGIKKGESAAKKSAI